jgi:hypothetical protein
MTRQGMAIVCATVEGLFARSSFHTANTLSFCHGSGDSAVTFDVALDPEHLNQEAKKNSFFSYIAGN